MHSWVLEGIGWMGSAVGAAQALVLAQVVVKGDGLGESAQLALVIGLVLIQITSVILLHIRRSNDD